ncbi:MAG: FkbM family methyltransferase [Thalassobaculaceae bacterium]|nr:FkbM family methyltransferase [Thalassobaculaceae bacterium]
MTANRLPAEMRTIARRAAVLEPANVQATLHAAWPPHDRAVLARTDGLIKRLRVLAGDNTAFTYMDARAWATQENSKLRAERYGTEKVWQAVAPNGRQVSFPLETAAAEAFKSLIDESGGMYERPLLNLIDQRVGLGDVFIDVGAHVGYVSAMAATTGATVFAIEFQRELIPLIEQAATLNEFDLLRPLHVGASQAAGLSVAMRGHLSPGQKLETALSRKMLGDDPASVLNDYVPVMTLDQLFDNDLLAPKLVKIDVEGHEIGVLEGARGLIARGKTSFVVEFHPHLVTAYGRSADDLIALLPAGWRTSQLSDDGLAALPSMKDVVPDIRDPNPKLVFDPPRQE